MKSYLLTPFLILLHCLGPVSNAAADVTFDHDTTLSGIINVTQDIILTDSATLNVAAGSTLLMSEGVSIKGGANCHIIIQGTSSNKVIVKNAVPNTYWGQLIVSGKSASMEIYFADIMCGQTLAMDSSTLIIEDSHLHDYLKLPTKNIVYTGNASSFHMNRCHVSNYWQLNHYKTPILVENSLFEYIHEDGIDMDNSPSAIIRNCTFRNGLCQRGRIHSVDAIDFGKFDLDGIGSSGEVRNCLFYNITDKGVSAGEGCAGCAGVRPELQPGSHHSRSEGLRAASFHNPSGPVRSRKG